LITSQNTTLLFIDKLGRWLVKPHHDWEWFYSPTHDRVNRRLGKYLHKYTTIRSTRAAKYEWDTVLMNPLPTDAYYAMARFDTFGLVRLEGWAPNAGDAELALTTIRELIKTWDNNWPLEMSQFFDETVGIVDAIQNGTAISVCDGSYMPQRSSNLGAAAWIIENPSSKATCNGMVKTSGEEDEVNPYQSELQGIHTVLMAILAICRFYNITEGKAMIGCDNEKAGWLVGYRLLQLLLHTKHANLVRAIRKIVAAIPIKIEFVYVEGHQDDNVSFDQLDRISQLNVMMDYKAKWYLQYLISLPVTPTVPSSLFMEGWSCWVDGVKTMTNPAGLICQKVFGKELCSHLDKKEGHRQLAVDAFELVDWKANAAALENAPTLFSLWATKHISGFCGVGKMMKHWNFWDDNKCLNCPETVEDAVHILLCPYQDRVDAWEDAVNGF